MSNLFSVLYNSDDDDDSDDSGTTTTNPAYYYYCNDLHCIDRFSSKEVSTLARYFLTSKWKIEECQIVSALIRNDGDLNKSGGEIQDMINNKTFDIRYFFADTHVYSEDRPYLSSQEWIIDAKDGVLLLCNDEVYEIISICTFHKFMNVVKIIDQSRLHVLLTDDDVKFGKYKLFDGDKSMQLQKEYDIMKRDYDKIKERYNKDISLYFDKIHDLRESINEINSNHSSICCAKSKMYTFMYWNLPCLVNKEIYSYGLDSDCNHFRFISDIEEEIGIIYARIDDIIEKRNDLGYELGKSGSIANGWYDEWLENLMTD